MKFHKIESDSIVILILYDIMKIEVFIIFMIFAFTCDKLA